MVNTVCVRENGPLAFHAQHAIDGETRLRSTLCRCGASKHKPFCDGSHTAVGFIATGEPAGVESTALATRDGLISVMPVTDGPLKVSGPLEVVSGTGRTINRTSETFLCRCGASQHKPFCDGSHRKVGFKSE